MKHHDHARAEEDARAEEPRRRPKKGHGRDVKLSHRAERRGERVELLREAARFGGYT